MAHARRCFDRAAFVLSLSLSIAACSSSSSGLSSDGGPSGGSAGTGGKTGAGGSGAGGANVGSGGNSGSGGKVSTGGSGAGGAAALGGAIGTGGSAAAGGAIGTGGSAAAGGAIGSGGKSGSGGAQSTGGSAAAGGTIAAGGSMATGGTTGTGGKPGTGGAIATGGSIGTGGSNGAGGSGGAGGEFGFTYAIPGSATVSCNGGIGPITSTVTDPDWLCTFHIDGVTAYVYSQSHATGAVCPMSIVPLFSTTAQVSVNGVVSTLANVAYDWGGNHHNDSLQFDYGGKTYKYYHSSFGIGARQCQPMDCINVYAQGSTTITTQGCSVDRTLPEVCVPIKADGTHDPLVDKFKPCAI